MKKLFYLLLISYLFIGCAALRKSQPPEPIILTLIEELKEEGRIENIDNYIKIEPPKNKENRNSGIIFYPGGKVMPSAYIALWNGVALDGYTIFIVKMPLNLSVFNSNAATKIINKNLEIESWAIAGHSLGGVMAFEYMKKNRDTKISSIILIGSYPAQKTSLADRDDLKGISIREEHGFENTTEKAAMVKENFPKNSVHYLIKGSNHAQFGRYGLQKGDGTATISPEAQHTKAIEIIVKFLNDEEIF